MTRPSYDPDRRQRYAHKLRPADEETGYLIRSKYEEHARNISFRFDEKTEHVEQSP
jgi:hypothetical protein